MQFRFHCASRPHHMATSSCIRLVYVIAAIKRVSRLIPAPLLSLLNDPLLQGAEQGMASNSALKGVCLTVIKW